MKRSFAAPHPVGHLRPLPLFALFGLLFLLFGCSGKEGGGTVVLYCSLDRNFAEPILKDFERRTGIHVAAQFDIEANKTVGHYLKIREEMNRPRADVFWNNEAMLTVRLKRLGALAPYHSPVAEDIPTAYKDPEGFWTGFAARARIFIINTDLLPDPAKWPRSFLDLVNPLWKGRGGMARPLSGTTAAHGTVLFQVLGGEKAAAFFEGLLTNGCHMTPGNAYLMKLVRKGKIAFGFTDTDDFNVARLDGFPVASVYPDQGDGEPGTLVIPNTIALIKGAPHPEEARKLIDFILSPEVEERLAFSSSAQIPLRPGLKHPDCVKVPDRDFRAMVVDWDRAAGEYEKRQEFFRKVFLK